MNKQPLSTRNLKHFAVLVVAIALAAAWSMWVSPTRYSLEGVHPGQTRQAAEANLKARGFTEELSLEEGGEEVTYKRSKSQFHFLRVNYRGDRVRKVGGRPAALEIENAPPLLLGTQEEEIVERLGRPSYRRPLCCGSRGLHYRRGGLYLNIDETDALAGVSLGVRRSGIRK